MPADLRATAVRAARDARGRLSDAMAALQSVTPAPDRHGAQAERLAAVVQRLFAAETRDAGGVLDLLVDALRRLGEIADDIERLREASDEGAADALTSSAVAIASALTVLHPARAELARALDPQAGDDEPVIPLARKRESRETDRRRADRVRISAEVGFHTDNNFFTGLGGDVGSGGLFVATWNLLPIGTKIELSFVLPSGRQVVAQGRVSWVRLPPEVTGSDQPPGMGVAFEGLAADDEAEVDAFVAGREPLFHE